MLQKMKRHLYHGNLFTCPGCLCQFQFNCALSTHQAKSKYCDDHTVSLQHFNSICPHVNQTKEHVKIIKAANTNNINID